MSMPPDPLAAALRAALDDERSGIDDDVLIARAIARATNTLATGAPPRSDDTAAAPPAARSSARVLALSAPRKSLLRTTLPLAAMFAASVALASVYLASRSAPPRAVAPSELPEAPPATASPSPKGPIDTHSPGEIPSISVTDLPSTKPSAAVTPGTAWHTPPPTSEIRVTAAELFRDANAERRSGNVDKSVDLYLALQRQFPDASETRASRVSLGRVLLDRKGDATSALAQFDAYLNGAPTDGTLSEEARLGRALALQRLGQSEAEREAWQDLATRHPQSLHAARAKERLRALGGSPGGEPR